MFSSLRNAFPSVKAMTTRKWIFPGNICKGPSAVLFNHKWAASSEFGTYRLCEQRRFRRACASAQSRQNLRCSLIQAVNQEEPSDRKPDPWPLWMAGHAQLKFIMTECSKTQIRLTRPKCTEYMVEVIDVLPLFKGAHCFFCVCVEKGQTKWLCHEKTCFLSYANIKGADQPADPRSLISTIVVRYLDSMIPILAKSKMSSSVAEQAGLSLTWLETPKTGFLVTWL